MAAFPAPHGEFQDKDAKVAIPKRLIVRYSVSRLYRIPNGKYIDRESL
jgi:hypothetical protein